MMGGNKKSSSRELKRSLFVWLIWVKQKTGDMHFLAAFLSILALGQGRNELKILWHFKITYNRQLACKYTVVIYKLSITESKIKCNTVQQSMCILFACSCATTQPTRTSTRSRKLKIGHLIQQIPLELINYMQMWFNPMRQIITKQGKTFKK